jgi:hypothetical protein
MSDQIQAGDQVRLLAIPDWLIHDLPDDEKIGILACVGKKVAITEIDSYGYFWIGLDSIPESSDGKHYIGQTFCVPRECLELVSKAVIRNKT